MIEFMVRSFFRGLNGVLILMAIFTVAAPAFRVAAEDDEAAFQREVKDLNRRYEDFFAHEAEEKRYYERLKSGVGDVKANRKEVRHSEESALRKYKSEKRPPPDSSALEAQHEAELKAERQIHDRRRKAYIENRNQLRRISSSARKIPENRDAGLE